jgi:arylsulfatase A-like enzyme
MNIHEQSGLDHSQVSVFFFVIHREPLPFFPVPKFFLPFFLFLVCLSFARAEVRPPNVLFILADDLGFGDLGCYGNPDVDTPTLDGLADAGLRFTAHYAPSSLCAPSRAAILTGRFNHRTGAVDVPSNRGLDRLDLSEKTFGDYFRSAGYRTALMGKWHNGLYCREHLPHQRGFDLFFGFPNGATDYYRWHLLRNDEVIKHDGRYLSDVLNDEASAFIRARGDQSFALFLAHLTPHSPLQAPEPLLEKYRQRMGPETSPAVVATYAMIEAMDQGLQRVFDTLKAEGIWEQTIIVFTSDNGPVLRKDAQLGLQKRFNGPFSGDKDSSLEGGIRVPAIVAWPGTLPGGRVIDIPIHGSDWLPTLFALTGKDAPADAKPFDGKNLLPLLMGEPTPELLERPLFFQRNRYAPLANTNAAIRKGPWKLYWPGTEDSMKKDSARDNPPYQRGILHPHWEMPLDRQLDPAEGGNKAAPQLFHLEQDPGEMKDLAAQHPDLVQELSTQHQQWFDEVLPQWQAARQRIIAHDQEYWSNRESPDPLRIYQDFWLWRAAPAGTNPKTADPLQVFPGYWNMND